MQPPTPPATVLFICTGNSARSQMAEAWLRALAPDRFRVYSAGLEPKGIHPLTYRVMAEVGLDLAGHTSKPISAFLDWPTWDYVITVCGHADANCPAFLGRVQTRLHWGFDDPAAAAGAEAERLAAFRQTRDAIAAHLRGWLAALPPV